MIILVLFILVYGSMIRFRKKVEDGWFVANNG